MRQETFGQRLRAAMEDRGPLCVGIDPHPGLLIDWRLPDTAVGARDFGLRVVESLSGRVAAVKPQAAFFERYGAAGLAALEEILAALREERLLAVLDVKRGDIGSTMAAYAQAYLGDDAPLRADAITVSPYLGVGALAPAFDLAEKTKRGLFVLALTSNPEGKTVQHSRDSEGVAVASNVATCVNRYNKSECDKGHLGSFGLVVGATIGDAPKELGLDFAALNGPILAPGIGAQGAGPVQVRAVFAGALDRVLASTSRGVLRAGPKTSDLRQAAAAEVEAIRAAVNEI